MPGARFSQEQKAKAVRLVAEATPQHESQWAAIQSVAGKIGASAETVRKWVRRAEVDAGERPGMISEEHAEVKRLKRVWSPQWRANRSTTCCPCSGPHLVEPGLRDRERLVVVQPTRSGLVVRAQERHEIPGSVLHDPVFGVEVAVTVPR